MSEIGSGGVKASAGALGMGSEPEQGFSRRVRWDERLEQRTRDIVMRACVGLAVLPSLDPPMG